MSFNLLIFTLFHNLSSFLFNGFIIHFLFILNFLSLLSYSFNFFLRKQLLWLWLYFFCCFWLLSFEVERTIYIDLFHTNNNSNDNLVKF